MSARPRALEEMRFLRLEAEAREEAAKRQEIE